MRTKLNLRESDPKLYLPERAKILKIKDFTENEKFFELALLDRPKLGHVPGQFLQVSVLGIGEAPISISSAPAEHNRFDMCVRAIGDVTKKLHTLNVGDIVYIRGPFGNGFAEKTLSTMLGKHLLFIVGGLGYAPLRSLINKVVPERDKYKKISVLYGCRTSKDRMYAHELDELSKIGGNVELLETVDKADENWTGSCGVITTLIPKIDFNPNETIAMVVGPPIMYKFVLKALLEKNMPKENIYIDLERRMKCGVGKCGHCQMEGIYVCQEGPVFNYAEVEKNEELL
ncbi:MAG: FAD/NAD(P)-binding protein [Gammaproteobacteria bacterium]|nr:FAD/NAD(P)-binding protein [Gammaproteobacteria bacterium]